jgi:hypothetical protein
MTEVTVEIEEEEKEKEKEKKKEEEGKLPALEREKEKVEEKGTMKRILKFFKKLKSRRRVLLIKALIGANVNETVEGYIYRTTHDLIPLFYLTLDTAADIADYKGIKDDAFTSVRVDLDDITQKIHKDFHDMFKLKGGPIDASLIQKFSTSFYIAEITEEEIEKGLETKSRLQKTFQEKKNKEMKKTHGKKQAIVSNRRFTGNEEIGEESESEDDFD